VADNRRGRASASLGLRLQAQAEFAPFLRERLRVWLEQAGATTTETFEVVGTITDRTVTISIRDYGTWNSEQTRKEDGGLGLVMMEELMNTVQVKRALGGTTVTMRRRLTIH